MMRQLALRLTPPTVRRSARMRQTSVELPESYVGSAEHVEDLRQLRSQAPTELRDDLDLITTHFDNTVDPSDPDSQLTDNFPEDVNAAIARVTAYIDENCVE